MILVGTSGYSYDDWVGPFYPQGTSRRDFLRFYAQEFPLVELNFSYYAQPQARTLARMVEQTPETFRFAIKAHRSLTHEVEDAGEAIRRYREGIEPLAAGGRLAAVLFQFPYSFHYTPESRRHLERICQAFADLPAAVEFRNGEWLRDSVYDGLRGYGTAFVNVDEPRLPRLPAPSEVVTSPLAYLRFHGRNRAQWWRGDNVTRYDYLYSRRELESWLPRIKSILERARMLIAAFNNHSRAQAVQNARDLQLLLGLRSR